MSHGSSNRGNPGKTSSYFPTHILRLSRRCVDGAEPGLLEEVQLNGDTAAAGPTSACDRRGSALGRKLSTPDWWSIGGPFEC
jgi:hypothetical protein